MEYSQDVAKVLTKQIDDLSVERDKLIESIGKFRNMLHDHPCALLDYVQKVDNPFYEISADLTKIIYVNPATEKMFGISRDALYEDTEKWFSAIHPDDRERVKEYLFNLGTREKISTGFEYKMIKSDGRVMYVQDFAMLSKKDDGEQHSIIGFVVDITKHIQMQKSKFVYEQIISSIRFSRSIEQAMNSIIKTACNSMDWDEAEIWVYDSQVKSFYCISVYHRLTEEIAEYYQIATSLIIDADTDFQGYVIRNNKPTLITDLSKQHADFNVPIARRYKITTALGIPIICHEKSIGVMTLYNRKQRDCEQNEIDALEWVAGVLGGIIQHNLSNQKLQYITSHNDLTGLLNRNGLESSLNTLITQNESDIHGIIMLDITRFKLINETYNFEIGDILLRQLAVKFQEELNDITRIIASLGGDIFAFVVPKLKTSEALKPIIEKILTCLQRPFEIKNNTIYLQASIGISIYPYDGLDIMTLLKKSDIALKHAKSRGGSNIQFSTQALQHSVSNALRIENGLRRALVDNQFRLHYQPKVDLRTGKMVGLEALIRWNDPQNGLQYPDAFMHIAQQSDLIIYIGEWVFLRLAYHFPLMDFKIPIAVNLDSRQLKKEYDFLGFITQLIKKMSLPTELLELEVTEAEIMYDAVQSAHIFQGLQKTGVSIAIDDFGSGYSSYAYLKQFKPDRIKIDKSFIDGLPLDRENAAIVKSIIALCHILGMKVTAEGVETREQAQFLMQEGCDEAQGYYFSKPLQLYELRALIKSGGTFKLPE